MIFITNNIFYYACNIIAWTNKHPVILYREFGIFRKKTEVEEVTAFSKVCGRFDTRNFKCLPEHVLCGRLKPASEIEYSGRLSFMFIEFTFCEIRVSLKCHI